MFPKIRHASWSIGYEHSVAHFVIIVANINLVRGALDWDEALFIPEIHSTSLEVFLTWYSSWAVKVVIASISNIMRTLNVTTDINPVFDAIRESPILLSGNLSTELFVTTSVTSNNAVNNAETIVNVYLESTMSCDLPFVLHVIWLAALLDVIHKQSSQEKR